MTPDPNALPAQAHGLPGPAEPPEVLRQAYKIVLAWFRRRVPDIDTAQDLTQATFVRFRGWQHGNPGLMPDNLHAFLLQQAEWLRRDHFRKGQRSRKAETARGGIADLAALEDARLLESASPMASLPETAARSVDLHRAVASLPDGKRLALVLRFVDDLATEQIAEVLGVSTRRVNQIINEAFEVLAGSEHLVGHNAPQGGHQ